MKNIFTQRERAHAHAHAPELYEKMVFLDTPVPFVRSLLYGKAFKSKFAFSYQPGQNEAYSFPFLPLNK